MGEAARVTSAAAAAAAAAAASVIDLVVRLVEVRVVMDLLVMMPDAVLTTAWGIPLAARIEEEAEAEEEVEEYEDVFLLTRVLLESLTLSNRGVFINDLLDEAVDDLREDFGVMAAVVDDDDEITGVMVALAMAAAAATVLCEMADKGGEARAPEKSERVAMALLDSIEDGECWAKPRCC